MPPKDKLIYMLNSFSFQRPLPSKTIKEFSFWGLTDDLYKAIDFVKECKGFESVWLGNKGFQMTSGKADLDVFNSETLTLMLKKTKEVILHRMEKTFPVLQHIGRCSESFQQIESVSLECHSDYLGHIGNITKLRNLKSITFHQAYFDLDS